MRPSAGSYRADFPWIATTRKKCLIMALQRTQTMCGSACAALNGDDGMIHSSPSTYSACVRTTRIFCHAAAWRTVLIVEAHSSIYAANVNVASSPNASHHVRPTVHAAPLRERAGEMTAPATRFRAPQFFFFRFSTTSLRGFSSMPRRPALRADAEQKMHTSGGSNPLQVHARFARKCPS